MAEISKKTVCAYLKRKRDGMGIAQGEMADRLDYESASYVSQLENNKAKWPLNKIPTICTAYKLSPVFICVMVKAFWPDVWEMAHAMANVGFRGCSRADFEAKMQKEWNEAEATIQYRR